MKIFDILVLSLFLSTFAGTCTNGNNVSVLDEEDYLSTTEMAHVLHLHHGIHWAINFSKRFQEQVQKEIQNAQHITTESLKICLKKQYFCYVDCKTDFQMNCDGKEKAFAVFIPEEEHLRTCVQPKLQQQKRNRKSQQAAQQCALAPCSCKDFKTYFKKAYTPNLFRAKMVAYESICKQWCKSGVVPAGVITKKKALSVASKIKKFFNKVKAFFKKIFKRW